MISEPAAVLFRFRFLALAFAGLLAVTGLLSGAPWPERVSDLPRDPELIDRRLPNGLRYQIKRTAEPKESVSLRLVIAAGSLHERDDERGLAHFLEHMIFRGTVKHPGDELPKMLQRAGLAFGPDHTAFTNYDHTIYHLELPRNTEESLRLALSVFFEYGSQATIDAAALETERGVILSEMAMRDTADVRYMQSNFEFLWPASLPTRRAVIGDVNIIKNAPRERVAAFYDAWYRPERMALLVAGDVDPALVERCLVEIFSPFPARGPSRPEPTDTSPAIASPASVRVLTDPAMVGVSVHFQHARKREMLPDTREERMRRLRRDLGFTMFHFRLQELARAKGDTFVAPSAGLTQFFVNWEVASLSASSRIVQWKELLSLGEQELRRALAHGFQASELEPVKKYFLESLDADVRTAKTRRSEIVVQQMVGSLLNGNPFTTPTQVRDEWTELLVEVDVESCSREFRASWGDTDPHITLAGNPALEVTEAEVEAVLTTSRAVEVTARAERAPPVFAYQSFGPEGRLVHVNHEQDLDLRQARFENGVRFNFKSTDFDEDRVSVVVRLPGGRLSLKQSQAGLDWLAGWAYIAGGIQRHTSSEMVEILAGRSVSLSFNVGHESFFLRANCSRRDLHLALKLMTAHLTDPAWREEASPASRAAYGGMLSDLLASPSAPIRAFAERIIYDDKRYGIPSESEYYRHELDELARWLGPKLKQGPMEISIVGDTTWEEASSAVAKTLGALPKRPSWPKKGPKPPRFEKAPSGAVAFTVAPEMKQSAIAWVFPAPELSTVAQERRARFLSNLIEERVRQRLRQELGSAYAPETLLMEDEGLPGCSYFLIYAEVDHHRTAEALRALRNEFALLKDQGFTADEFERVRAPFLRSRADDVRQNSYWLFTVLADSQQRPERLAAARDRMSDTASIRREELEAALRQWIIPENGFLFISEPAPGRQWAEK